MKILAIAVASLAFTAVPAAAVTVVDATSIRITSAAPDYLQVAEVRALTFDNVNVALGASATSSSTYDSFSTAAKAVDGNTNGSYYSDKIFHSQGSGAGEFLEISFGPSTLASLTLFGRSDCCSERDVYNVQIFAGSNLLYSGTLNAYNDAHSASIGFDLPVPGVPEPTTWMMLIAGFGLVGGAARYRRKAATAA